MIYVYQILKQIRLRLDYSPVYVREKMGKSARRFNELESQFVILPVEYLRKWLDALDISLEDQEWFVTQHWREINFTHLPVALPVTLRLALATLLTVPESVSEDTISRVNALINAETLKALVKRPRCADIVIDSILLEDSK